MFTRRFPLTGMLAVLLALMAQLGMGATVPRIDPITGDAALCHTNNDDTPSHVPANSADCLICPLCVTLHSPAAALVSEPPILMPPAVIAIVRTALPPPSTAPPAPPCSPSQPRAPPRFS
jgi:hypothetical protein